jgi:hypothetical protein
LILVGATGKFKRKPTSAGNSSKPAKVPTGSLVEPYRKEIEAALAKGLTAQRIWQDLREDYGTGFSYYSVKRLVHELKKRLRFNRDHGLFFRL